MTNSGTPLWLDATNDNYCCDRCPVAIPEGEECAWLPASDELLCRDCGIDAELEAEGSAA